MMMDLPNRSKSTRPSMKVATDMEATEMQDTVMRSELRNL